MSVSVRLGKGPVTLPNPLSQSKTATIESVTLSMTSATQDNTAISFMNNMNDILITIGIRRFANTIVLNSKRANGGWEAEEYYPNLMRVFGPNVDAAKIVVKDTGNAYEIRCNGNYLTTYTKRIGGGAEKISYDMNSSQDSPLANPITVKIE
ncbi:hypothetical protein EUX98_g3725 [Antrodiella citrinella]|uniref:Galectin n=1 Tax=Antrodiella citrinella TaxID=2447956 RepID=A0A4V3XIT8_9APHY|nr:hypothetical protein EUX98_g3725 [Antrodiella citrinella]